MSENKSGIKFLLVLAAIAALIILANFIKKSVEEYELKTDYNTAIQLIEDGNYSDAEYKFYALGDYEDSKVLTNYAGYMRSKSNIYSAHHYMSYIPKGYNGVFADEIAEERKIINERYDEYLKQLEEEEKKAEEEREKLRASYANKIPEVGMDREFIKDTLIGKCDQFYDYTYYEDGKKVDLYRYTWYSDDKSDIVFVAEFKGNRCISAEKYYPTVYWRGDIPNFSAKRYKPVTTPKYREDRYGALDYSSPEDFYYDNYDYFAGYEDAEDYYNDIWG